MALPNHFKCSMAGVDSSNRVLDYAEFNDKFPFVEFAVLYSTKRAGNDPRYPELGWINRFANTIRSRGHNVSIHLCGDIARAVYMGEKTEIDNTLGLFSRVQLNINMKRAKLDFIDLQNTLALSTKPIIVQYNDANADLFDAVSHPNLHLLFDASGGLGIKPLSWLDAEFFPDHHYFGYAGGLDPDTIYNTLPVIERAAGSRPYWLDMESGVRTNDQFDLTKADRVATLINYYYEYESRPLRRG